MKKTEVLVDLIVSDIEKKDVLEVACGAADFSVSASRLAGSVSSIDLDDSRLSDQVARSKIYFQIMDASKMAYSDNVFDTIVIYNAFFHIYPQWDLIEKECKRVLKETGIIYIAGSWKLDTHLMIDVFGNDAVWQDGFLIVKMTKRSRKLRSEKEDKKSEDLRYFSRSVQL
jgi:ubiquinone/menaquinone biosynthesis C-methylase UbiE